MAQKNARRNAKQKTTKQQEKLIPSRHQTLFILFSIFGFSLRLLGTLIANGFRIIGGNTYQGALSRIGRLRGWLAIKTTEARFTSLRRVVGCVLIYLGILVILHAHLFNNVSE